MKNQVKPSALSSVREWVRDIVVTLASLGLLVTLIYIATILPSISRVASSTSGLFLQAESYGRETGVTAADLPRMLGPRSKESGVAFANSMRDAVIDGSSLMQTLVETKALEALVPLARLIGVVRPEQMRLLAGVVEKQILSGNVDRLIDFFAADEQSSLSARLDAVLDGDLMHGLNALGGWLQHNDTQAMLTSLSSAPLAQMIDSTASLLTDMQRYHAANALSKLTDVLIRVTDALHKE